MDQIAIHIELDEKIYEELNTEALVRDNIGLTMNIMLENYRSVPRSEGGKLNRVVDKRTK